LLIQKKEKKRKKNLIQNTAVGCRLVCCSTKPAKPSKQGPQFGIGSGGGSSSTPIPFPIPIPIPIPMLMTLMPVPVPVQPPSCDCLPPAEVCVCESVCMSLYVQLTQRVLVVRQSIHLSHCGTVPLSVCQLQCAVVVECFLFFFFCLIFFACDSVTRIVRAG